MSFKIQFRSFLEGYITKIKDLGRNYLEKEMEGLSGKGNITCKALEVKEAEHIKINNLSKIELLCAERNL